MENKYFKFSAKALLLALGLYSAVYAQDFKGKPTVTKHGDNYDNASYEKMTGIPGFAGQETSAKNSSKQEVSISSEPKKNTQKKSDLELSIGAYIPSANYFARTSAYNINSAGSGLGFTASMKNFEAKTCPGLKLSMDIDSASEHMTTHDVKRDKNVGTIDNQRNMIKINLEKKINNLDLAGGIQSYTLKANENYAGIQANSAIGLTGIDYNISYSANDVLKVAYGGKYLAGNDSDVTKLSANEYSVSVGPVTGFYNVNSFDSTNPGIQQLYQQGIFPTEIGARFDTGKYSASFKAMSNKELTAGATEFDASCNITKNIKVNFSHSRVERNSRNKTSGAERTTVGASYRFGDKK